MRFLHRKVAGPDGHAVETVAQAVVGEQRAEHGGALRFRQHGEGVPALLVEATTPAPSALDSSVANESLDETRDAASSSSSSDTGAALTDQP
jgi:hypothetical protein